jgi:toxin ParE1/3/4
MTSWVIHPDAELDLASIWDYTVESWGIAQAQRYLGDIERAFADLCGNPSRGRPCPDLKGGLWQYPSGSHIIFFQRKGIEIVVVRVLHNRMDIPSHLA